MAGVAVLGLGTALATAGTFAAKSASEYEQNRIAFDTMLGSAEKARDMLKQVSEFAMKTPFELPEVVNGAKQLLAYNIEAEKIIPTFNALGNIAAGVGKEKLPQLILAFGQVKAATKLTGMELRQFTEAGVPMLATLGKQMGKTEGEIQDMVSAGDVKFKDVEKALFGMSEEGGKFFNLMERQSKTFGGTMSNIKDDIGRVAREIIGINETGDIRQGSIFYYLKIGAEGLYAVLDANKDKIIQTIQGAIDFVINLALRWREARDAVMGFFSETNYVWVFIRDFLQPILLDLANTFKTSWKEIMDAIEPIKPELKIVAEFFGVIILGAIMAVIVILAELIKMATKVATGIINVFSGAIQFFENGWTGVILLVTGHFNEALGSIKKMFSGLGIFIKGIAESIFAPIYMAIEKMVAKFTEGINKIKDAYGSIKDKLSSVMNFSGRAFGGSVTAGTPYIVGEYRPEVFVPSQSGNIKQMGSAGGSVTINFGGVSISNEADENRLVNKIKRALATESALGRMGIS
jgi:tape measure domain-containing protein